MQKKTLLVAFCGRKRSGKDTAALYMADIYEREQDPGTLTTFFAFADYLKKMVNEVLGISQTEADFLKLHERIKVQGIHSYREFLNHFGDVLKSRFGNLIFTKKMQEAITVTINNISVDLVLVTDVRYPHEIQGLQDICQTENMDFMSIKLINTKLPPLDSEDHESETLQEDIKTDHVIEASSPQEIKIKIEEIYNEYSE